MGVFAVPECAWLTEVSDCCPSFFFPMPKGALFSETGFPDTDCEVRCCRLVHLYDYGLPFLRRLD
jgi:hypothetical protein